MLNTKFVRAHHIPTATFGFAWFFKLMYEFWGFCVNGSDSLTAAGGFSSLSGIGMPAGFQNGVTSSILLSSGTDGFTADGMPFFNTVGPIFSASYVGKHLVCWKSGSTSTDDSIYEITQWINSSSVRVNVLQGGTPYSGSLHPAFAARASINYRVINFANVTSLPGYTTSSYLVMQFNGAPEVNVGQSLSQAQLRFVQSYGSSGRNVGITLSPSGSWTSSSFTDPSTEILGTTNSNGWFPGADSPAYITLIGSQDFLLCHYKGQQPNGSGFHIEIPQRLYPQPLDPNPITVMNWGSVPLVSTDGNQTYGGGLYVINHPDNTTYKTLTLARTIFSDTGTPWGSVVAGRTNGAVFNSFQNKFLFSDGTLSLPAVAGQFSMCRFRLRRVRFMAPIVPQFQRIGNNGEWIHMMNGIMWPWDNTLLPYNLLLGGS